MRTLHVSHAFEHIHRCRRPPYPDQPRSESGRHIADAMALHEWLGGDVLVKIW